MPELKGFQELAEKLRAKVAAAVKDVDVEVVVGFTAKYAVWVHENLEAHHPTGQAKFLEQPAREGRPIMQRIIVDAAKGGRTVGQAVLLAGLWLQAEAQKLCPVDTGNLRASAFTRMDVHG